MKKIITEQFDVLVVGGGPAGLMAAGRAAECGARVALVEKNDRYGIKLLMSGNGRCNITQDNDNAAELSKAYKNGRFLISAFSHFSPSELRNFFSERGLETKVEKNGRIFPVTDQGKDVLEVLYQYCRGNGVTFFQKEEVLSIEASENIIEKIVTRKKEISAEKYIIAVGGKSYPSTGSSGDGYAWMKKIGHSIIEPAPCLVPIALSNSWTEKAQGISAHNITLHLFFGDKKIASEKGDLMFAHYGLSGPVALNISRNVRKILESGNVQIRIDLKPELSFEQIDEIIRKDFEKNANRNISNCLKDFASPKLLELIFEISGADINRHAANVSREERQNIARFFNEIPCTVENLFGFEKAMVTTGGVAIREIDSKTMRSKLFNNLYFAGEIIDADGPTGGYNLQMCWSTGFVAGQSAAKMN